MRIHLIAHVKQRGTGARDEPVRESRVIEVEADSYEDGKDLVLDQVPDGWIVASWRTVHAVPSGHS